MTSEQAPARMSNLALSSPAVLALIAALTVAGCSGGGAGKAGGAPATAPNGTITLTFASAEPLPVDTTFAALVDHDSGGHLMLRTVSYNNRSASVDPTIAADLQKGKLDVGDVGSRAWESLGVTGFRAYQDPFLITSRELLDAAVTGPVAAGLLPLLKPVGITGLAVVPVGIRYLYSTRPLVTPAQFTGAKIAINESATSAEVIDGLGATPVTDMATGPAAIQALRDGALTAIESSPQDAVLNGYEQVAPYVVVNAPLFAKTSTFAINSAQLTRLPASDAAWLREAAQQAAATAATSATDRTMWASACGQGLKPLAVTAQQLAAFQNDEAPAYADLAGDPQTTLAIDEIGGLATTEPRMDAWATCHGIGRAASPTEVLDGSYGVTMTQADVVASGDCTDCGNAGTYRLVIDDGRYALYHPVQKDANPDEPSVSFFQGWGPDDPVEVGAIAITGNQATLVPEVNQQNGSVTTVYSFELFHGLLTWHQLSGAGWDSTRPWRQLS
jgi:TRAP-type C4-dicarboxylate transport system substrate-binding protein